jgi:hypothetical protein
LYPVAYILACQGFIQWRGWGEASLPKHPASPLPPKEKSDRRKEKGRERERKIKGGRERNGSREGEVHVYISWCYNTSDQ